MSITLTVAEIASLAAFAGLTLDEKFPVDADEAESEIVVCDCPPEGLTDDDGKVTHHAHIAYFSEYPEEGSAPLGPEIT